MNLKQHIAAWALAAVLALGLAACNEPRDRSSYHGHTQWVPVSLALHGGTAQRAATGNSVAEIGTSYVVIVPDGTAATPYFWTLGDVIADGRLDPATGTIAVTLPTGVSMRVFEYVYNQSASLADVLSRFYTPVAPQVSAPFVIGQGVSQQDVSIPVQGRDFSEGFTTAALDPTRWETGFTGAVERRIVTFNGSNALRLGLKASDTVARSRLRVNADRLDGSTVTAMEADVTLLAASGGGVPRARLAGMFYHTATSGEAAGDATGDIFAAIGLDGTNALYRVGRCLNDHCGYDTFEDISGVRILTPVALNATVHLKVEVDPATGVFTFTATPATGSAVSAPYDAAAAGYPVSGAPHSDFKEIAVRADPEVGETASATAVFDNVAFDGTAYDNFDAGPYISFLSWNEGTSAAEVVTAPAGSSSASGNALQLTAAASYTGNATLDTDGSRAQVQVNRNLVLDSHRIAGTVRLPSAGLVAGTDVAGSQSVNVRATARLHYQPRAQRGNGATDLTGIGVGLYGNTSNQFSPQFIVFNCLDANCTQQGTSNVTGNGPFINTPTPLAADTDYDFALEYVGSNRVRGIFNGEARVADLSTISTFDPNELVFPLLRAQARRVFDAGDQAGITALYSNIEVGEPTTPSLPTALTAPAFLVDAFGATTFAVDSWDDPNQYRRTLQGGQLRFEFLAEPTNCCTEMRVRADTQMQGISTQVTLPSDAVSPTASSNGVFAQGGVEMEVFEDSQGSSIIVGMQVHSDGFVSGFVCRIQPDGSCQDVTPTSVTFSSVDPTVAHRIGIQRNGGSTFTFTLDGTATGPLDVLGIAGTSFGQLLTGDDYSLRLTMGAGRFGVDTGAYPVYALFDNVQIDSGSGFAAYEDFAAALDGTRWEASADDRLQIVSGALEMATSGGGDVALDVAGTPDVTVLSADVTVNAASGDGRFNLYRSAYTDGTRVLLGATTMSGTEVAGVLFTCSDTGCVPVVSTPLGSVTVGTPHTLYLQWDGGWFAFQLDDNPAVILDARDSGVTNTGPFGGATGFSVANLKTSGSTLESVTGSIRATVDNVRAGGAQALRLP